MTRTFHRFGIGLGLITLMFATSGCSGIKQIADALTGLGKLQFKLDNVNNFAVAGVNISNIGSVSDIPITQAPGLIAAFQRKQLPVTFTLNVLAKNPNDGANQQKSTDLFLRKIAWTLLIDGRTTINGVTEQRLMIPGSGQSVTIPISLSLDLYKFFNDKGYNDLINLALAIGGAQGSSSRLKLTARVTAEIPGIGQTIEYPGDITIVNTGFSNP